MLKVKYEIFEDYKEELKGIELSKFDEEYHQIYGLFTITIGEQDFIPYPSGDIPLSAKKSYSELLLSHFELLNEVVKFLSEYDYVALKYIEDSWSWLEFVKMEGDLVKISELEYEIDSLKSLVSTDSTLLKGAKFGSIKEVSVSKEELVKEIKQTTKLFTEEIKCINPMLLKSKCFSNVL
ncbi:hypothetical protein [Bacillus sp. FJAT-27245]|uniref:hypothetical protein n=1 Tax=Bacillus sp. FJAT-27245 TaxID=1684144 RepID=UPI0006A7E351|nr:hypothetical protein [Bacillus sp. FJAT-27245]